MAEISRPFDGPTTEDALIAERFRFWDSFLSATKGSVIFVIVVLVLMAIFLV